MDAITDLAELEALFDAPGEASLLKVAAVMTPLYRKWIMASRFCILSTVGPEGTDASPRGDTGPVVQALDENTLLLPDWRGNNRIDSLRNILRDDRVSLMFMVPGSANVIRVNGTATITKSPEVLQRFDRKGTLPKVVIAVRIGEIYSQCARAIMRSGIWSGQDESDDLPTVGQMLKEQQESFDAQAYDASWPERAAKTLW